MVDCQRFEKDKSVVWDFVVNEYRKKGTINFTVGNIADKISLISSSVLDSIFHLFYEENKFIATNQGSRVIQYSINLNFIPIQLEEVDENVHHSKRKRKSDVADAKNNISKQVHKKVEKKAGLTNRNENVQVSHLKLAKPNAVTKLKFPKAIEGRKIKVQEDIIVIKDEEEEEYEVDSSNPPSPPNPVRDNNLAKVRKAILANVSDDIVSFKMLMAVCCESEGQTNSESSITIEQFREAIKKLEMENKIMCVEENDEIFYI